MIRNLKLLTLCGSLLMATIAWASDSKLEYEYKDWMVFSNVIDGEKTCFMHATPQSFTGSFTRRGQPHVFVTKIDKNDYQLSVSSGYPYKKSGAHLAIARDSLNY